MRGVAEGRVVRHLAQSERRPELAPLREERDQPAVVDAQALLDDQQGEELGLGEDVLGVPSTIGGERPPPHAERLPRHLHR